jgi:hypothetical protein
MRLNRPNLFFAAALLLASLLTSAFPAHAAIYGVGCQNGHPLTQDTECIIRDLVPKKYLPYEPAGSTDEQDFYFTVPPGAQASLTLKYHGGDSTFSTVEETQLQCPNVFGFGCFFGIYYPGSTFTLDLCNVDDTLGCLRGQATELLSLYSNDSSLTAFFEEKYVLLTDPPGDVFSFTFDNGIPGQTPLPTALPLFATGLGALGLLGWRRKLKNAAAIAA